MIRTRKDTIAVGFNFLATWDLEHSLAAHYLERRTLEQVLPQLHGPHDKARHREYCARRVQTGGLERVVDATVCDDGTESFQIQPEDCSIYEGQSSSSNLRLQSPHGHCWQKDCPGLNLPIENVLKQVELLAKLLN